MGLRISLSSCPCGQDHTFFIDESGYFQADVVYLYECPVSGKKCWMRGMAAAEMDVPMEDGDVVATRAPSSS